jgi:hypothetical protein
LKALEIWAQGVTPRKSARIEIAKSAGPDPPYSVSIPVGERNPQPDIRTFLHDQAGWKGHRARLALVHSVVVKGHSGKIWIESAVVKGAAFVIQLPVGSRDETQRVKGEREPSSVPN